MKEIVWVLKSDYANEVRFQSYRKKHERELISCLANLNNLLHALNMGLSLQEALGLGFFRSEGENIYRIGQSGVAHAKETRLYVYARITGPDIQILTIGDKKSQQRDIDWCKRLVRRFDGENDF